MAAWTRAKRRRQRVRLWRSFVCLLLVAAVPTVAFFRFRPVLTDFAESQALWVATEITNRIVESTLVEQAHLCDDMVSVTYTDAQQVTSVIPNTQAVNSVRTAITAGIMDAMEEKGSISVSIPLGTLLGAEWLSGWGPLVTFPIGCTATVFSDVTSSIEAVGINQSVFTLHIVMDVQLLIVTPGGRSTVETEVSYPMVETVLLGEVPDNLTEVYGDDQSLLGQIFDYGTVE